MASDLWNVALTFSSSLPAEELQELMDETGLDVDEAHELWEAM